jgi:hypothetical protein
MEVGWLQSNASTRQKPYLKSKLTLKGLGMSLKWQSTFLANTNPWVQILVLPKTRKGKRKKPDIYSWKCYCLLFSNVRNDGWRLPLFLSKEGVETSCSMVGSLDRCLRSPLQHMIITQFIQYINQVWLWKNKSQISIACNSVHIFFTHR